MFGAEFGLVVSWFSKPKSPGGAPIQNEGLDYFGFHDPRVWSGVGSKILFVLFHPLPSDNAAISAVASRVLHLGFSVTLQS